MDVHPQDAARAMRDQLRSDVLTQIEYSQELVAASSELRADLLIAQALHHQHHSASDCVCTELKVTLDHLIAHIEAYLEAFGVLTTLYHTADQLAGQ